MTFKIQDIIDFLSYYLIGREFERCVSFRCIASYNTLLLLLFFGISLSVLQIGPSNIQRKQKEGVGGLLFMFIKKPNKDK